VPGAVGVESVGLRPVGEVMGCIVQHIGFAGWRGCGYYGGFAGGLGGMADRGFGTPRAFGGGIPGPSAAASRAALRARAVPR